MEVICKLLLDDSATVRHRARAALDKVDDTKALDILFKTYYNGDEAIRRRVVMVLNDMEDEADVLARLRKFKVEDLNSL